MDNNKVKILNVKIDKVTMEEAYNRFISLFKEQDISTIFTPNPEIVMKSQRDSELMDIINSGDLVVPDGIGLIYASKIHGLGLQDRVPGIELMDRILNYCNKTKKSIFLLGAEPDVIGKAAKNIGEQYKNIKAIDYHHGYFKDEEELEVLDLINEKKPDVLFVGLGSPKQEKWINKHQKILNANVAMGVGGSFDVWSGKLKRAPKLFIKLNIEWLYRFLRQPKRFKRLFSIPKFMFKVILNKNLMEK
jgi:N-acetylglucosaminyldiphosphoundecaprenol N-acetyl-beta-D-mannosaminyltransferase